MMKRIFGFLTLICLISTSAWANGQTEETDGGKIVLTLADNQPDQSSGAGLLLAKGIEEYQKLHPEVEFELLLNDNETHRQKLKIWIAANQVPDIYSNWADPAALSPFIGGGYAAPLNKADYADYKFLPGCLDELSRDGNLYGLPRNFDIWSMFYNEALFEEYGLEYPKTIEEMKDVAAVFNENGIIPCALNGRDKWNQVILLNDLLIRTSGGNDLFIDAVMGDTSFSEENDAAEALAILKDLADSDFFQKGYIVDDYATAQSYFTQEKAAMYWIGTWEMGMANREDYPESFRKNVRVGFMPGLSSPDTEGHLIGRTGMAFFVNDTIEDEKKEVAKDFLSFLFEPDHWTKWAWEMGILTPAQSWADYELAQGNQLTDDVTKLFDQVKSTSGQPVAWLLNGIFETEMKDQINEMLIGNISQEEYWKLVDRSAAENR